MKIGQLALLAQTQVETVRYYEREGLMPQAPRSEGNYRVYGPKHVERLSFVRQCRSLDMTLDEIRLLLRFKDEPQADCGEVNALLDQHIDHVAARIRELRQLEKQLKALREQCRGVRGTAHCGILNQLVQASSLTVVRPASAHVHGVHGGRGVPGRSRKTETGSAQDAPDPPFHR